MSGNSTSTARRTAYLAGYRAGNRDRARMWLALNGRLIPADKAITVVVDYRNVPAHLGAADGERDG
jgi:hypothetical protein